MVRGMSVEDIELAVVTGVDAYATRGSLGEELASDDGMAAALERHVDGAGERNLTALAVVDAQLHGDLGGVAVDEHM